MAAQQLQQRRSKRDRETVDYAKIEEGISIPLTSEFYFLNDDDQSSQSPASRWGKLIKSCQFMPYNVRRMLGTSLTLDWVKRDGLIDPFLVPSKYGLGLVVPTSISVRKVAQIIGMDDLINVIDVSTQEELKEQWTLGKWANYFEATPYKRKQIYHGGPLNVISLEFSHTPLYSLVRSPDLIRQLDLIDNAWPEELRARGIAPKAQYYCLMSVAGSYTDFHIDFGGTSVWYHVLSGKKVFLLIPPTETNLTRFQSWSSSPFQSSVFFAQEADRCYKVEVNPGETLVIPSGWIHAVYTPKDSLVFGGNFLHTLSIEGQFKCYQIEKNLKIKERYSFPFFQSLMWYTASYLILELRDHNQRTNHKERLHGKKLSSFEIEGLPFLIHYLRQWYLKTNASPPPPPTSASSSSSSSTTLSPVPSNKLKIKITSSRSEEPPCTVAARSCGYDDVLDMLKELESLVQEQTSEGGTSNHVQDVPSKPKLKLKLGSSSSSATEPKNSPSPKLVLKFNTSSSSCAKYEVKPKMSESQLKLHLPSKQIEVAASDVACSVVGCHHIDLSQKFIPHWNRSIHGMLLESELKQKQPMSYPVTWTLHDQSHHTSFSPDQSEHTMCSYYPLCFEHEEERYQWQISNQSPPRYYIASSIAIEQELSAQKKSKPLSSSPSKTKLAPSSSSSKNENKKTKPKKTKREELLDFLKKNKPRR